jgi:hypothetical protein
MSASRNFRSAHCARVAARAKVRANQGFGNPGDKVVVTFYMEVSDNQGYVIPGQSKQVSFAMSDNSDVKDAVYQVCVGLNPRFSNALKIRVTTPDGFTYSVGGLFSHPV